VARDKPDEGVRWVLALAAIFIKFWPGCWLGWLFFVGQGIDDVDVGALEEAVGVARFVAADSCTLEGFFAAVAAGKVQCVLSWGLAQFAHTTVLEGCNAHWQYPKVGGLLWVGWDLKAHGLTLSQDGVVLVFGP
jgi:hypothetical protein